MAMPAKAYRKAASDKKVARLKKNNVDTLIQATTVSTGHRIIATGSFTGHRIIDESLCLNEDH